jgi:hypothetical protein
MASPWAIITTMDAPSSNVFAMTGLTLTTYKKLCLEMSGVTVTTDGTDIRLTFFVSGSEITGTSYQWQVSPASSGNSVDPDELTGAANILLVQNNANWDVGNAAAKSFSGRVYIDSPASTALHKRTSSHVSAIGPTGNTIVSQGSGVMLNAGAIDGVKLSGTSNLTAGKVRLLGLA